MLDCEPHRRTGLTGPIHYYNEYDAGAATWLRNLIEDGLIPYGHVDTRDIRDVQPDDLSGYAQCHFFAGIGGWARALSLAAWPEDREIWTGSCPCQPFSVAGRGAGTSDARHLWPDFLRLIAACRPAIVMGEQVAGAAGFSWFDGVGAGLDGAGYTSRAVDIPACSVDAPHKRSRLYWIAVADRDGDGRTAGADWGPVTGFTTGGGIPAPPHGGELASTVVNATGFGRGTRGAERELDGRRGAFANAVLPGELADSGHGRGRGQLAVKGSAGRNVFSAGLYAEDGDLGDTDTRGSGGDAGSVSGTQTASRVEGAPHGYNVDSVESSGGRNGSFWSDYEWLVCHDDKARRTIPGVPLLVNGIPGGVVVSRSGEAGCQDKGDTRMIQRTAAWKGFGNAIVPPLAAEVIIAFLESEHG